MTPKQIERIQGKIVKIKRALAADKRRWGGYYDDSRGLRYLAPEQYIKIRDYKGALRYFNWFSKTFDDDMGFPFFLFKWSITLFKNGKLKEAEKKMFQAIFISDTLIDKFLEQDYFSLNTNENSSLEIVTLLNDQIYNFSDVEFKDFSEWLSNFIAGEFFRGHFSEFLSISRKLKTEPVGEVRFELVEMRSAFFR
ncbi:MAG: hypothetical protein RLZZ91_656 [Bacteroidota bacterium]|jgi:hypothetical protein